MSVSCARPQSPLDQVAEPHAVSARSAVIDRQQDVPGLGEVTERRAPVVVELPEVERVAHDERGEPFARPHARRDAQEPVHAHAVLARPRHGLELLEVFWPIACVAGERPLRGDRLTEPPHIQVRRRAVVLRHVGNGAVVEPADRKVRSVTAIHDLRGPRAHVDDFEIEIPVPIAEMQQARGIGRPLRRDGLNQLAAEILVAVLPCDLHLIGAVGRHGPEVREATAIRDIRDTPAVR